MVIPIVRSWPTPPRDSELRAEGRLCVDDDHRRVYCSEYDMSPLREFGQTGVIHLDWDIAVDPYDLRRFAARCTFQPRLARFADYRLGRTDRQWASQHVGFVTGCSYFPPWMLLSFHGLEHDPRMTDCNLSAWLVRAVPEHANFVVKDPMAVVHLHY